MFLHLFYGFGRQLLPRHAINHVLFSSLAIANADNNAGQDIYGDGETEDDRRDPRRSSMIAPGPGKGTEHDLEYGVKVQQDHSCDHELDGECMMGRCFVWFVEGVGF